MAAQMARGPPAVAPPMAMLAEVASFKPSFGEGRPGRGAEEKTAEAAAAAAANVDAKL
jgi:hypothetical protein